MDNVRVMEIGGTGSSTYYPQTYQSREWLFWLKHWVTVQRNFKLNDDYSEDAVFDTAKEAFQCLEDLENKKENEKKIRYVYKGEN